MPEHRLEEEYEWRKEEEKRCREGMHTQLYLSQVKRIMPYIERALQHYKVKEREQQREEELRQREGTLYYVAYVLYGRKLLQALNLHGEI